MRPERQEKVQGSITTIPSDGELTFEGLVSIRELARRFGVNPYNLKKQLIKQHIPMIKLTSELKDIFVSLADIKKPQ